MVGVSIIYGATDRYNNKVPCLESQHCDWHGHFAAKVTAQLLRIHTRVVFTAGFFMNDIYKVQIKVVGRWQHSDTVVRALD